jgi:hypothetical protein
MLGGVNSDGLCPKCGKKGVVQSDEFSLLPIYDCIDCQIMFGRCNSGQSSINTGCGEIATFQLIDSYSIFNQKFADFIRKQHLESDNKSGKSGILDEKRAQLLASLNDSFVVFEEEFHGEKMISLRVPSWMSEEGSKLDIEIDNTMCSGASTVMVCSKCDIGHFYDIMWDNQL